MVIYVWIMVILNTPNEIRYGRKFIWLDPDLSFFTYLWTVFKYFLLTLILTLAFVQHDYRQSEKSFWFHWHRQVDFWDIIKETLWRVAVLKYKWNDNIYRSVGRHNHDKSF